MKDKNNNCMYCKKKGHGADKYQYLVPAKRWKGWKQSNIKLWVYKPEANKSTVKEATAAAPEGIYEADGSNISFIALAAAVPGSYGPSKEWIWDTGSARHIIADKQYFTSLRMYKPGETAYSY
ncbi:hypothetical protein BDV12DRAFT_181498 [Aspergillus spectabilis]